MDINERLTLNALFNEVDDILIAEMDKLLDLGVEPDIDGNHCDPRWAFFFFSPNLILR